MKYSLLAEWLLYEAESAIEGENPKECWHDVKMCHPLLSKIVEHHKDMFQKSIKRVIGSYFEFKELYP